MTEPCEALTYGCYVVTTTLNGRNYGLTCCYATQIDSDLIMLCLSKQSTTRQAIVESGVFGVSVLAEHQKNTALHFGQDHSAETDKFEGMEIETGQLGVPLLPGCRKTVECEVVSDTLPGYDQLLVGRIKHYNKNHMELAPLLLQELDEWA